MNSKLVGIFGVALLGFGVSVGACGGEEGTGGGTTGTGDSTTGTGGSTTGTGGGATGTGGGATGTGGGATGTGGSAPFDFPAPLVAGTPETDALANDPARCGQPAYTWLKSPNLGNITAHEKQGSYTKALLETLLTAAKITIPLKLQYDVDVHLITYTTQDRGKEIEATALLAWPSTVPEGAPALPTLTVLHGTSGFMDGCGATSDTSIGALASAIASSGFAVIVPDYIGLKATPPATGFLHPYLVGQATAIASLDAVRILGHLPAEIRVGGARPSPRLAVIGGSQGGHAALWVDRLAPYYARELELVGVAATVPPADLIGEGTLALTMLRNSTGNMVAFFGASSDWYGTSSALDKVFVPPFDTSVKAALGSSCDPGALLDTITSLDKVFQPALLTAATNGTLDAVAPWGCIAAENGLTSTPIKRIQKNPASYGVLFVTGELDELVDTPTERVSYGTLCKAGMPLNYLECKGSSHSKTTAWALPEILEFVQARLAGEAFTSSCDVTAAVTCQGTPAP
jgi:pimeloyl-ACP methyl ester carboxylesterase